MNNSNNQERYYNILKLNKWFALSSILFTAFWILVFADDFNRPWKKYQIEFRKIEIEKVKQDINLEKVALEDSDEYESLINALSKSRSDLELESAKVEDIKSKIKLLNIELYKINQDFQFSKADMDAQRYAYEEALFGHGNIEEAEKKYNKLRTKTDKVFLVAENKQSEIDELSDELKLINANIKKYEDAIFSVSKEKLLLERRLTKLDPESMNLSNKVANIVRDLPVIDFIDPYYDVKQVVVNDLKEDLVYMGMPKVDRCMTCHVGIDKKGFEDQPQPYTTHPRLDEFAGGSSPHPMSEYGCTSCHAGRGRGTDFISSGHMPKDEIQAKEWKEKYGWEALHYWEDKMLPAQYVEAGCFKCHSDNMPVVGAETLTLGMATFEKAGCYSCHSMDRWEDTPKPGPSLYKLASKADKDWVYRWIMEPRAFRHNTWMPHFFKKGNNSSPEDILRSEQETLAMTEYLYEYSEDYNLAKGLKSGDP